MLFNLKVKPVLPVAVAVMLPLAVHALADAGVALMIIVFFAQMSEGGGGGFDAASFLLQDANHAETINIIMVQRDVEILLLMQ